jgi:predicted RNA-binding protein (virulence factor B family)
LSDGWYIDLQDVVRGEVLPAYVEQVQPDGKINVSLRVVGGKAKTEQITETIMEALENTSTGEINVGDKSDPRDISAIFPGTSKSTFKKGVAALYRQGKVQPGPNSIKLIKD